MAAEIYRIGSNLPIAGSHWGLEFEAGVAYTKDVALAGKLLRKGYAVTCVSPPAETPPPGPPAPEVPEPTSEPEPVDNPAEPTEPAEQAEPIAPEAPANAEPPKEPRKPKKG